MERKILLIMTLLILSVSAVSAVDEDLYHRCTDDVSVDINNNTFTIDMPGRTVDLQCGQQLTRDYSIEFFEDITAQCKSDDILENFTAYFRLFSNNFQTFMGSYNLTPNYYDDYLICSQSLAGKTSDLTNCNAKESVKDYKADYDTCTSQKIVIEGEKNQITTTNNKCQTKISGLESDRDKYKDQRFLFLGGGLIVGAAILHPVRRKDKKVAESPAQRQLPQSR